VQKQGLSLQVGRQNKCKIWCFPNEIPKTFFFFGYLRLSLAMKAKNKVLQKCFIDKTQWKILMTGVSTMKFPTKQARMLNG
jgi:hypothetical protein